jgi:hypothetical protein
MKISLRVESLAPRFGTNDLSADSPLPYAASGKMECVVDAVSNARQARLMRMMNRLFQRWVLSRLWLTFIVLGLSFLAFGMANTRLLSEYGWQAITDGALRQLLELAATGYLSIAAYIVFKTCEHRLSDWLGHGP